MTTPSVAVRASVIIPCWNQLEFTRKCLAALFRQTRPGWELIVVNNGSTDGTADYLAGVQDVSPVPVTVIANGTNRGFPAAVNQGLQYARGKYLVLLNNDVVVTEGWLEQLTALVAVTTGGKSQNETPLEDVLAAIGQPTSRAEAALGRGGTAEVFDLELGGVRLTLLPTSSSRADKADSARHTARMRNSAHSRAH